MTNQNYNIEEVAGGVPVKMWTKGVPVEDDAKRQLANAARLPIVFKHIAAMPDVHLGIGATVGSVIPTLKAIIPAAVGVDIGCGMMAAKTTLRAEDLPDNLGPLRSAIEQAVPHGSAPRGRRDTGSWENPPVSVDQVWATLADEFDALCELHPRLRNTNNRKHLGTLGTGNHFIEVCLDEAGFVWFMLHSGSRGVGNAIGTHFIELAKKDAQRHQSNLPDENLAYFEEGAQYFGHYVRAVSWAQKFALRNREVMMANLIATVRKVIAKPFESHVEAVNCHHNYVQRERHFGEDVFVTRKGAVSAKRGELGIIPGSMGARSHRARPGQPGKLRKLQPRRRPRHEPHQGQAVFGGRPGARDGRRGMPQGRQRHRRDPDGLQDIDAVMAAQRDLVEVVHTLKQVVCVKG